MCGVLYSESVVSRCMRHRLQLTWQAVQVVPQQLDPSKRDAYLMALRVLITNPNQIVFGDEAHKTRAEEERRHGYYQRGGGGANVRRYITTCTGEEGNYTFFGAANNNDFRQGDVQPPRDGKGTDSFCAHCSATEHISTNSYCSATPTKLIVCGYLLSIIEEGPS